MRKAIKKASLKIKKKLAGMKKGYYLCNPKTKGSSEANSERNEKIEKLSIAMMQNI
jgi:hypothetical protein